MGQYRTLDRIRGQLEVQIRDLEPSFARHELFRFLKSKRYEITPESLANATAGLPYMGWRQSMRRCKERKSLIANGGLSRSSRQSAISSELHQTRLRSLWLTIFAVRSHRFRPDIDSQRVSLLRTGFF